jgi:predicted nucleotidyltransferase
MNIEGEKPTVRTRRVWLYGPGSMDSAAITAQSMIDLHKRSHNGADPKEPIADNETQIEQPQIETSEESLMNDQASLSSEYLITLPKRGLRVQAPAYVRRVMEVARKHKERGERFTDEEKQSLWPDAEKARLRIMTNCSILRKRYPTREEGERFMHDVDYDQREFLLGQAGDLTLGIVESWQQIAPDKPIAVVLYGSVAKGLVKRPDHPDPSNIDLTVIGDISPEQRLELMDSIRSRREKVRERILARVPKVDSREHNPGNAGVMVQHTDRLLNGGFYGARNYIASGAFALHDPKGIWKSIESEAIEYAMRMERARDENRARHRRTVFNPSGLRTA